MLLTDADGASGGSTERLIRERDIESNGLGKLTLVDDPDSHTDSQYPKKIGADLMHGGTTSST